MISLPSICGGTSACGGRLYGEAGNHLMLFLIVLGIKADPGGKRPLSFGAMPICRFKPGPGEDGGAAGTIGDC